MGWASHAIEKLKAGEAVQLRPRGNSMKGRIESGDLITVVPCAADDLHVGDAVLCRVKGKEYVHLIKVIDKRRYQIGNNLGGINGWVSISSIYGRVASVDS